MLQLSVWMAPPLLASLVLGSVYAQLRSDRSVPGTDALRLMLTTAMVWAVAEALALAFTSAAASQLMLMISACCGSITALAWLTFALAYGMQGLQRVRPLINALAAPALLLVLAAFTNPWHRLYWADFGVAARPDAQFLIAETGPLHTVQLGYNAILIVAATVILAYDLCRASTSVRPAVLVLTAMFGTATATILAHMPWNPYPWAQLDTLGMAFAAVCIKAGMLTTGLLNRRRVARDQIVDAFTDGVLVLDADGTVVDANASGLTIVGMSEAELNRRKITELITTLPFDQRNERQRSRVELTLGQRAYEIATSPLNPEEPELDSVLVFRDVTQRREQERRLRAMQQELEEIAHTDALTKLFNRRVFMRRLDEEVERVRRHGSALSVLLFDLDHFKSINDRYGHDMGDRVLRTVARVAASHTRVTDVAARIGGEEFALLLPETKATGALQLANRLREAIETARTPQDAGPALQVTASIGVATVGRQSKGLEQVLKCADVALYDAKHHGRNRVSVADT
ncbi:MAG: diguanylate cyclase [Pseudomonadota bacterium]